MAAIRKLARTAPAHKIAIALIRVSKERDGMTSPDVQRHAIESYAAANRITVVDWVEGIDESGSRAKSAWWPKLNDTIDRVEAGEANTILVWKFSRTARHRLRWAVALDRMDVLGGEILSVTEPIESRTASGKFARGMLGEMNAYQADLIGEGWKETLERRVREGLPGTGRPRFGYAWDRTYTPDPALAPIVREMYRRSVAGHGMASITRWLNDQGLRTRNGNEWQTIGVTRYMDRGFAAGFIWSAGVLHPGAHDAIVDPLIWDAYVARRAGTKKAPRGSVRMLSGLMKCATCGGPMSVAKASGDFAMYACARRRRGGQCAGPAYIDRKIAENHLTEWVHKLEEDPHELLRAEEREQQLQLATIEDRAALSRLIRRTEERLSRLTLLLLDDPPKISQAAYDASAATLNGELTGLRQRFARTAPGPKSNLFDEAPALIEGWDQMEPAAQNRVARTLLDRIIVSKGTGPDRIEIVPRWGTTN